jgi:hypothetical protein
MVIINGLVTLETSSNAPFLPLPPSSGDTCYMNLAQRDDTKGGGMARTNYLCGRMAESSTSAMCNTAAVCFKDFDYNQEQFSTVFLTKDGSTAPALSYYNGDLKVTGEELSSICEKRFPNEPTSNYRADMIHYDRVDQSTSMTTGTLADFEVQNAGKIKWIEEPTMLIPQHRMGPNIYHIGGMLNGAMQWYDNLQQYGLSTKYSMTMLGSRRLGTWGYKFAKASRPERMKNFGNIMNPGMVERNQILCYRQPLITDWGHSLLQFVNETVLPSRSAPLFNRDAHAMKERVWRRVGRGMIPQQLIIASLRGAGVNAISTLETKVLTHSNILHLKAVPRRLTYVYRPLPTSGDVEFLHIRALEPQAEEIVRTLLRAKAVANGYQFKVVDFNTISFEDAVNCMRNTGITVGLHGAGLVNSMFMPSGGALLEISPWKFKRAVHYIQGGFTNLYYDQYIVTSPGPRGDYDKLGEFKSELECQEEDVECRQWYRDQTVTLNDHDVEQLSLMVDRAFIYLQAVEAGGSITVLPRHS